jgi:hypothetical protein
MFGCSTALFMGVFFVKEPILNISLLVLAVMAGDGAATMLWSRYCPSLRDTGMVSGATGFLDFLSYMAAAISSSIFANTVASIGWGNLVLVWAALMAIGVLISLPYPFTKSMPIEKPCKEEGNEETQDSGLVEESKTFESQE